MSGRQKAGREPRYSTLRAQYGTTPHQALLPALLRVLFGILLLLLLECHPTRQSEQTALLDVPRGYAEAVFLGSRHLLPPIPTKRAGTMIAPARYSH